MDYRLIINCLVIALFVVAAGINLWNIMIRDAHRKHVLIEAVIGLGVLLVWAGSEFQYLR
jgi:hypothetical protein